MSGTLTYLDTLDDEADKVGEDSQQVNNVQGSLEELPLSWSTRESNNIF